MDQSWRSEPHHMLCVRFEEPVDDGNQPSVEGVAEDHSDPRRIVIVGVCASGKTMLADALRARGYDARQCLQEHSYVPTMCERISRPDILIHLKASLDAIARRRRIDFGEEYLREQRRRLAYAAARADLTIDTDALTPDEVLDRALVFLRQGDAGRTEGGGGVSDGNN